MSMTVSERFEERQKAQAQKARLLLSDFAERAAQLLQELAELSENDRIRLSAVNSILDRAGVVAPSETQAPVSPEEHQLVRGEAEETLKRIEANLEAQRNRKNLSIEAIVLHEGEVEPEPVR